MHKKPRKFRRKEREWINRNILQPIAKRMMQEIDKAILYGVQKEDKEVYGFERMGFVAVGLHNSEKRGN